MRYGIAGGVLLTLLVAVEDLVADAHAAAGGDVRLPWRRADGVALVISEGRPAALGWPAIALVTAVLTVAGPEPAPPVAAFVDVWPQFVYVTLVGVVVAVLTRISAVGPIGPQNAALFGNPIRSRPSPSRSAAATARTSSQGWAWA